MKQFSLVVALLCVTVFAAAPVLAGIVDSPLPVLVPGKKTFHVYSVPVVMQPNSLGTSFACTSMDTAPMQVGVELFDSLGGACNDAAAESHTVNPGQMVIFAAKVSVDFPEDQGISMCSSRGSARILATSKKLSCTVFIADAFNDPPTSMMQLTIIKQKTQKGD